MPHDPKDYESAHLPDQTGFVWDFSGGRLVITGLCPACSGETRHPVPRRITPGAVTKGGGGASPDDAEVPSEVFMQCRCRRSHPGDTRETGGCGAKWTAVRQTGTGS
ncbi:MULTISPECIES: hypothetical protein [Streptomyces]|uniref:hypothetical protein n=1 Tax=Streptomyces TaxID=1883 RepID=UPI0016707E35|nr:MULTISPECIES: hypothetical protein [Streptomyces]UFR03625.1 hypothetical protein KBP30_21740 [Streptomyces sp. Go40/10]GGS57183.1 hypothetical protein GCM10010206_18610 [Streptomyces cinerochromogenes]